ncbi:MAG: hypothetical protein ACI4UA_07190 [Bacteroidaceae bacterium]
MRKRTTSCCKFLVLLLTLMGCITQAHADNYPLTWNFGGSANNQYTKVENADGSITFTTTGSDPYAEFMGVSKESIGSLSPDYLCFDYQLDQDIPGGFQVWAMWTGETQDTYGLKATNGEWQVAYIPLIKKDDRTNTSWLFGNNNTLTMRFDLGNVSGINITIKNPRLQEAEPYQLEFDSGNGHTEAIANTDGTINVRTTGNDGFIWLKGLTHSLSLKENVLRYEYQMEKDIPSGIYVFGLGQWKQSSESSCYATRDDEWKVMYVDIDNLVNNGWGNTGDYLRLDFGEVVENNIKLRNITLCEAPQSQTMSEAGYATIFDADNSITLSGNVKAYSGIVKGSYVALNEESNSIPQGSAVLLQGKGGEKFYVEKASSANTIAQNDLLGSDGTIACGSNIYVLALKDNVLGFYATNEGGYVPAGKAYINTTAEVKGLMLGECDSETAIHQLSDKQNATNDIYNLAGQRITRMQKGINIVNGKKIIF